MKRTFITFLITGLALALMVIKASTAGQGSAAAQQSQTSAQQQRKKLGELDASIREIDRKIEEFQAQRKVLEIERANLFQAFLRQSENQQQETVYLTPSGKTYHREACVHLGSNNQGRIIPISLDKLSDFYLPCSYCKPPMKGAKENASASEQAKDDPASAYDQLIAVSEANKTTHVYVSANDKFYHSGNCQKKSALYIGMPLHTISAIYIPCADCNPPRYYLLTDNRAKKYFITRQNQHYHESGCSTLANVNTSTIEVGEARGKYTPCPLCRPALLLKSDEGYDASTPSSSGPSIPKTAPGTDVHVKGYYRKDGTYVRPHTRSAPGSKKKN